MSPEAHEDSHTDAHAVAARVILASAYRRVRAATVALTIPLTAEDQCVQSMPQASPTKWHLAHTTWFFEVLVLSRHCVCYEPFDQRWWELFNSYYESLGPRHVRGRRGVLSRPSLAEVAQYRAYVDEQILKFVETCPASCWPEVSKLIELGLHHEQQHQELMLTDVLHAASLNPLLPALSIDVRRYTDEGSSPGWRQFQAGVRSVGHAGPGFGFDNEGPQHQVFIGEFEVSSRLVTNADYQEFIDDGGYDRPELWLSDGLELVRQSQWRRPLYWLSQGKEFTLDGPMDRWGSSPVRHVSFYEADAFARWAGARLPTEFEWEVAASLPGALPDAFGRLWQWTSSAYLPYPKYRPAAGPLGEYNSKFMANQMVLRGSSCATPQSHERVTYRNFFSPDSRWQFTGIRLARDL